LFVCWLDEAIPKIVVFLSKLHKRYKRATVTRTLMVMCFVS